MFDNSTVSRRAVVSAAVATGSLSIAGCTARRNLPFVADRAATFDAPERAQFDEPFSMTVDGLPPEERVELAVETETADGDALSASAIVASDAAGRVTLDEAEPVDGDVPAGIDVPTTMALVQFLSRDGRFDRYGFPERGDLRFEAIVNGETVGSHAIERSFPPAAMDPPQIDHDEVVGWLYEPPGEEPAPAVIFLHGSEGRPAHVHAAMLAANGFNALALQYFGGNGLPIQLLEIPLSYVGAAIEWLLAHERTGSDRVGLMGGSRGGELALLAGSEFDDVGAVVSVNGSGVAWEADTPELDPGSSWTRDGEPVPYVRGIEHDAWETKEIRPAFEASLEAADEETIAAATIPVEEIDGPVWLVSGADDALWDSVTFHEFSEDRLEAAGHDDFEHLVYESAGHGIVFPYLPVVGRQSSPRYALGGTPAGDAEADADYWPRALEALRAVE